MANAIPVHSSKKGKPVNDVKTDEPVQSGEGPVGQSGTEGQVPVGVKLDSHDAYRVDH